MNKARIAAVALLTLINSSAAMAAATGYYGKLDVGYSMGKYKDTTFNFATGGTGYTGSSTMKMKSHMGYNWGLAAGYYWTDSIRIEGAAFAAPNSSVKKITSPNFSFLLDGVEDSQATAITSKVKDMTYTGMVNVYYDMLGYTIMPYVTLGAGVVSKQAKVSTILTDSADGTLYTEYKFKMKVGAAYQGGVGASYKLAPNAFLDVGYRYTGNSVTLKCKATGQKLKSLATHSAIVGVRLDL